MRISTSLLLTTLFAVIHAATVEHGINTGSSKKEHVQTDFPVTSPTFAEASSIRSTEDLLQPIHRNSHANRIETVVDIDKRRTHQAQKQFQPFHSQDQLADPSHLQNRQGDRSQQKNPIDEVSNFQSPLTENDDSSFQQLYNDQPATRNEQQFFNTRYQDPNQEHSYSNRLATHNQQQLNNNQQQVPSQEELYTNQPSKPDQQLFNTEQQMPNRQFYGNEKQVPNHQFHNTENNVPDQRQLFRKQMSTPNEHRNFRNEELESKRRQFYNDQDQPLHEDNFFNTNEQTPAQNQFFSSEQHQSAHQQGLNSDDRLPEHQQFYDTKQQVDGQRKLYDDVSKEKHRDTLSRRFPKISDTNPIRSDKHAPQVHSQLVPKTVQLSAFDNRAHPLVLPKSYSVPSRSVIISGLKNLPVLPALVYNGGPAPSPHATAYSRDSWYQGRASVRQHLQTPFVRYVYGHIL